MSASIEPYSDNLHEDERPLGRPAGDSLGTPIGSHAGAAGTSYHVELFDKARAEAAIRSVTGPNASVAAVDAVAAAGHPPDSRAPHSSGQREYPARARHLSNPATGYVNRKPVDHAEDDALFRKYQGGDQQAFLKLYEKYKSSIYAYCARTLMSAGLDTSHVEDAFQEVFLRVAQYQHTFVGGEFKAWIFTVTRHTCLSTKKKSLKYKIYNEHVGDAENLDEGTSMEIRNALTITDDSPLEALSKREQIALLLKAIEQLPETYREALILSDYEGLTYDEIGKLTGTSMSTIRIRIFRAKARLRKVLLPIIGDDADRLVGLDPGKEDK